MKILFKILIIFLAVTGAVTIMVSYLQTPFGNVNFWDYRGFLGGLFFLFFIAIFPRLTLIFSSVPFGGLLWWLGLFFAPRILVATLATVNYWNTNPILVILAWLVALGGESSEKILIGGNHRSPFVFRSFRLKGQPSEHSSYAEERRDSSGQNRKRKKNNSEEVIDAEYKEL